MPEETELKLALAEDQVARFLRHPLLRQAATRSSGTLDNIYYDTPDLALRRRGISLRLRRQGGVWLQTVKLGGISAAGLSSRPEWETPYGGHFDFGAVDLAPLREMLQRRRLLARLAPICETRFRRTTWTFSRGAGTVIVVLDRGWIVAGGRREAICEIEMELAGAPLHGLFDIASALARNIALAPSVLSKAERGYRLHAGLPATPVRAAPVILDAAMAPLEAFRAIALSCLEHLQQNHAGAQGSDDPEYIHQMRVACRRLRAALRLFRPVLPDSVGERLKLPLTALMAELGRARDLDVLQAEIAEPVLRALPDEPRLSALAGDITELRYQARGRALALLAAPEYGRSILGALEALHAIEVPGEPAVAVAEFATERLRRLRRRLMRLAAAATKDDPASLHALRIGAKRQRYALDFFAPLAKPQATRRTLKQLAGAQDRLGQLNDLANAGALLMECAGDDPELREAVTLIGGWHAQRHAALLLAVDADRRRLRKLRLPALTSSQAFHSHQGTAWT